MNEGKHEVMERQTVVQCMSATGGAVFPFLLSDHPEEIEILPPSHAFLYSGLLQCDQIASRHLTPDS